MMIRYDDIWYCEDRCNFGIYGPEGALAPPPFQFSVMLEAKRKGGWWQIVFFWEVFREVHDVITQLSCILYIYNTTLLSEKGGGGANHTMPLTFKGGSHHVSIEKPRTFSSS